MKQHVLDERYRILELAGRGGMACVYRAEDLQTSETVAIKVLPPQMATKAFHARFKREFKTCSQLRHPNIIGLRDFGQIEDGGLYYAMDYLPWSDLEDVLTDNIKESKKCAEEFVFNFMEQMVSAFDYYHERGVVHRDLKPANVMISKEGKVVITDFGLALDINSTRLTATGTIVGSPLYMSPELISASTSDFRSDYYQLGIIVFNLLTGELPFNAPDIPTLAIKIMQQRPPSVRKFNPNLDEQWDVFFSHCLAKKAANRFQCARDLSSAIKWLKAGTYEKECKSLFPDETVVDVPLKASSGENIQGKLDRKQLRPIITIAAIASFLFCFFLFSRFNYGARSYSVANVETKSSFHSIEVKWKSDEAYPSRLFIEGRGLIEGSDEDLREHRMMVANLEDDKSFHYAIVFPNGRRSLEKKVATLPIHRKLISAIEKNDSLELTLVCTKGRNCKLETASTVFVGTVGKNDRHTITIPKDTVVDDHTKISFTVEDRNHSYPLKELVGDRANGLAKRLSKFSEGHIVDGVLSMISPGSELVLKTMGTLKQDGSERQSKKSKLPRARKLLMERLEKSKIYDGLDEVSKTVPILNLPLTPYPTRQKIQQGLTKMLSIYLFSSFEGMTVDEPPLFALSQWRLSPTPLGEPVDEVLLFDGRGKTLAMGLHYPVTNLYGRLEWKKSFSLLEREKYRRAELAITTGPSAEICLRITINGKEELLFYDPRPLPQNKDGAFGRTLYQRLPIQSLGKQNRVHFRADPLFRRFTRNQVLIEKVILRLSKV